MSHNQQIRDVLMQRWLVALLAYILTKDPVDLIGAKTAAGLVAQLPRSPQSIDVELMAVTDKLVRAIDNPGDEAGYDDLQQHLARISELRVRRTFEEALDMRMRRTKIALAQHPVTDTADAGC